jgi:ABC-type uncharacterized transport system permease subunit
VKQGSGIFGFAAALFVMNMKASLMLRGAFAMQVVFMALNNFTLFVFWWVLMRRVPEVRGWRLAEIQVLFGIVAVAVGLAVSSVSSSPSSISRPRCRTLPGSCSR